MQPFQPASPAPHLSSLPGSHNRKPGQHFESGKETNIRINTALEGEVQKYGNEWLTAIFDEYRGLPSLPVDIDVEQHDVTALSAAHHPHHVEDVGLNPIDFGMPQEDVDRIADVGLAQYIREGGTSPPIALLKSI